MSCYLHDELHAWHYMAQRERHAQSLDDPSLHDPPRQQPGCGFFVHDGFSPR